MIDFPPTAIAAITPHQAGGADDLASGIAISLMGRGWRIRGLAQERFRQHGQYQYMLIDLESSRAYPINQNLGSHAEACSLDLQSMADAACVLRRIAHEGADLAFINRFGKQEADGRGFSAEIRAIVSRGIPLLTIVQDAFLPAWRRFTGDLAVELPCDRKEIEGWLYSRTPASAKAAGRLPVALSMALPAR